MTISITFACRKSSKPSSRPAATTDCSVVVVTVVVVIRRCCCCGAPLHLTVIHDYVTATIAHNAEQLACSFKIVYTKTCLFFFIPSWHTITLSSPPLPSLPLPRSLFFLNIFPAVAVASATSDTVLGQTWCHGVVKFWEARGAHCGLTGRWCQKVIV